MTQTPLDLVVAPEDAAPSARLRFFETLADTDLFLLLTEEPKGETLQPETFDIGGTAYVLAFDLEERLSAFTGRPAPYAALPGRAIAAMLDGQDVGLGLNFDAPSQTMLPPDAVSWLVSALAEAPREAQGRITEVHAPGRMPEAILNGLRTKLGAAAGLAERAALVQVVYEGGGRGHLLAIIGAAPKAESPLARAVSEVLVFSGLEAGAIDVAFFDADAPILPKLDRVALHLDLSKAEKPAPLANPVPGSDPDKPPKLR